MKSTWGVTNFLYPLAANETQEIDIIQPTGKILTAEMNVKLGAWEEHKAWIISLRDITEKKQKMEQLEIGAKVFNYAHEGIMVCDTNNTIVDVNQALSDMMGYSINELLGKSPNLFKSDRHTPEFYETMWSSINLTGYWKGEIWQKNKNGTIFPVYLTISTVKNADNDIINYIGFCYDLILLKKQQEVISRMKYYDPLTDLPNHYYLSENLGSLMSNSITSDTHLLVIYIALEGLASSQKIKLSKKNKEELIIRVSQRLVESIQKNTLLVRVSHNDFIAVFTQVTHIMNVIPVIQKLIEDLSHPYDCVTPPINIDINIGIATYPQEQILYPEELIRQSHLAAYEAKYMGKNQYKFFDSPTELLKLKHSQQIQDIRDAILHHRLEVYYQPKVNLMTGEIVGAEALLRMHHPEKGFLTPSYFFPQLPNHPVFTEIGEWVLNQVLNDLEHCFIANNIFPISINIAPYHLQQANFLNNLKHILASHPNVSPHLIELEILETEVLENFQDIRKLISECKKMGVLFSLDDFGTGYCSLTYLKELPTSIVKLDQSFVRDIMKKPENIPILKASIHMCKVLKRQVIAEGVETIEIGKLLIYLGCYNAQGYAIAKPMSLNDFIKWSIHWSIYPEWRLSVEHKKRGKLVINAITSHYSKIETLKQLLSIKDSKLSPAFVLKSCALAKWLHANSHIESANRKSIKKLHLKHKHIFLKMKKMIALHEEGKSEMATRLIEEVDHLNSELINELLQLDL